MKTIKKLLLTYCILLTASMTVVAGMPHFLCVCPDGSIKPFCPGPTVRSSFAPACCCGGACCSDSQQCCCQGHCCAATKDQVLSSETGSHHNDERSSDITSSGTSAFFSTENSQGSCCSQFLVEASPFVTSELGSGSNWTHCLVVSFEARQFLLFDELSDLSRPTDRSAHPLPAPDLIIAFQHFLI